MAYGNYGGNVFKNGKRMRNHEDNTPYREGELKAGYWQAWGKQEGLSAHHATLGKERVRFCGYKTDPVLYLDGQQVDLEPYVTEREDKWYGEEPVAGQGEIEGYKFRWDLDTDPYKLNLWLTEPDGTEWTGFSGYAMGAGYEDEDEE